MNQKKRTRTMTKVKKSKILVLLLIMSMLLGSFSHVAYAAGTEDESTDSVSGEIESGDEDDSTQAKGESAKIDDLTDTEDASDSCEVKDDFAEEIAALSVSPDDKDIQDQDGDDLDEKLVSEPVTYALDGAVYLDGENGDDAGDGDADSPVATFDKAKELAVENNISNIYITGTVTVTGEEVWDGSIDEKDENLTLMRDSSLTDENMVWVNGGQLTLSNVTIDGKNVPATATLILVRDESETPTSVLNITEGTVIQHLFLNDSDINMNAEHAAVCVNNGTLNMTGGKVTNNAGSWRGGGIALVALWGSGSSKKYGTVVMNMSGGEISYNTAYYGGGIFMYGNDDYCSTLNMTGGTITHNTATNSNRGLGGGMYIDRGATAIVEGGDFTYNKAEGNGQYGGGAFYINSGNSSLLTGPIPGRLFIYNVEIAYNIAPTNSAYYGSTISTCPTGTIEVNITDGEVIHDNTDTRTFFINLTDSDEDMAVEVSPVMLGGGAYNWRDYYGNIMNLSDLYITSASESKVYPGYKFFYADTDVSVDDGNVTGLDRCTTHLLYNESSLMGSAIGTNGTLIIGREDGDVEINIEKVWSQDLQNMNGFKMPESILVYVYAIDSEGNRSYVGQQELTAENDWKASIEGLPKYDGDSREYTYIIEESKDNTIGLFSEVTGGETKCSGHDDYYNDEEKTAQYDFTMTNTVEETIHLEKAVEGTTDQDSFDFKITLENLEFDEDNTEHDYAYEGEINVVYQYEDGTQEEDTVTFIGGEATITVPAGGSASLVIGEGMKWIVEELTEGALSTTVAIDNGTPQEAMTASGIIDEDHLYISYVNDYEEPTENPDTPTEPGPMAGNPENNNPDGSNPTFVTSGPGSPHPDIGYGPEVVKTGDTNHIGLWITLMVAAVGITGCVVIVLRRRKHR